MRSPARGWAEIRSTTADNSSGVMRSCFASARTRKTDPIRSIDAPALCHTSLLTAGVSYPRAYFMAGGMRGILFRRRAARFAALRRGCSIRRAHRESPRAWAPRFARRASILTCCCEVRREILLARCCEPTVDLLGTRLRFFNCRHARPLREAPELASDRIFVQEVHP